MTSLRRKPRSTGVRTLSRVQALLAVTLLISAHALAGLPEEHFPVDAAMRKRVDFWKRVYTEITSREGYLHDSEEVNRIYEKIEYPDLSPRAMRRFVKEKKARLREQLLRIAQKNKTDLLPEDEALLLKLGDVSTSELRRMSGDIRHQQGMRDRYLEGLERSFLYIEAIRQVFTETGLPPQLSYLPHVESSFNYEAYSKVGAAGIWQFMRSTARVYGMKLNYVLDERRDPIASTRAAARFLRDNYERLKAWPLALTAYNHGPVSIERAVQNVGTRDLSVIIDKYRNRKFGFASKNFYATFVATAELSEDPKKFFPEMPVVTPLSYVELTLPKKMTVQQLIKVTGLDKDTVRKFNQGLRPVAYSANVYLPGSYVLRLPSSAAEKLAELNTKIAQAKLPEPTEVASGGTHVVARGENLFEIAKIYSVALSDLVMLNQLVNPSQIRVGMELKIPAVGVKTPGTTEPRLAMIGAGPRGSFRSQVFGPADTGAREKEFKRLARHKPADTIPPSVSPASPPTPTPTVVASTVKEPTPPTAIPDDPDRDEVDGELDGEEGERTFPAGGLFAKLRDVVGRPTGGAEVAGPPAVFFDPAHYDLSVEKIKDSVYQIRVETDETLGHFADWIGVPAQAIRRLNRLSYTGNIQLGQKLKLPLEEARVATFSARRVEYHQALEEDLFSTYRVDGTRDYKIRRGDTLAEITRRFEVPDWLLRRYQAPDSLHVLSVGQVIQIPQLSAIAESAPPETSEDEGE